MLRTTKSYCNSSFPWRKGSFVFGIYMFDIVILPSTLLKVSFPMSFSVTSFRVSFLLLMLSNICSWIDLHITLHKLHITFPNAYTFNVSLRKKLLEKKCTWTVWCLIGCNTVFRNMKYNYGGINYSWQVKCIGLHRNYVIFQLISDYAPDKHVHIWSFVKWLWWPLKALISLTQTCFSSGELFLCTLQLLINGSDCVQI